jgi:hypothetical protein
MHAVHSIATPGSVARRSNAAGLIWSSVEGNFDDETCWVEPIENPFGPNVLPMCSV